MAASASLALFSGRSDHTRLSGVSSILPFFMHKRRRKGKRIFKANVLWPPSKRLLRGHCSATGKISRFKRLQFLFRQKGDKLRQQSKHLCRYYYSKCNHLLRHYREFRSRVSNFTATSLELLPKPQALMMHCQQQQIRYPNLKSLSTILNSILSIKTATKPSNQPNIVGFTQTFITGDPVTSNSSEKTKKHSLPVITTVHDYLKLQFMVKFDPLLTDALYEQKFSSTMSNQYQRDAIKEATLQTSAPKPEDPCSSPMSQTDLKNDKMMIPLLIRVKNDPSSRSCAQQRRLKALNVPITWTAKQLLEHLMASCETILQLPSKHTDYSSCWSMSLGGK